MGKTGKKLPVAAGKRFGVFFAILLVYVLATSWIFPTDESGTLLAPDWYSLLGITLSWGLSWAYGRYRRWPGGKLGWRMAGVFLWSYLALLTGMSVVFPAQGSDPGWLGGLLILFSGVAAWLYLRREKALLAEARAQEEADRTRRMEQEETRRQQETLRKDILEELRRLNAVISDREVSGQIVQMIHTLSRIFDWTDEHPQADVGRLTNYYLPTTLKLLRAYADMEAIRTGDSKVRGARQQIEQTLAQLNRAYGKLLDDLVARMAMDVSGDIQVLRTILVREGLAEDELGALLREREK